MEDSRLGLIVLRHLLLGLGDACAEHVEDVLIGLRPVLRHLFLHLLLEDHLQLDLLF